MAMATTLPATIDNIRYIAHQNGSKRYPELYRIQVKGSELWEDIPTDLGDYLSRQASLLYRAGQTFWTRWPQRQGDDRDCNWYITQVEKQCELSADELEYIDYLQSVDGVSYRSQ